MSDLPPAWAWATLADVARWGSGGTPRTGNSDYYDGDIPWVVIGDMNDGPLSSTTRNISKFGLRNSSAKLVSPDVVLIAMYGSIGKLALPTVSVATNQAIAFAEPDSNLIDRLYLYLFLLQQRAELVSAGRGGTQQNISQTTLRAWSIPIPPIAEQRRIVGALEADLECLRVADRTLQQLTPQLKLLGHQLMNYSAHIGMPPARPGPRPRHADVIDVDLPRIPSSWRWERLGDIAEIVGGVAKDSKKQSNSALHPVPYLRVANVQGGYIDLTDVATLRVTDAQIEKLTLKRGDVLLNEGGDRDKLGRGWVWDGQIETCVHQNHVFRARLHDSDLDPRLVAWHANSYGRNWFARNGKQSVNLASVSLSTIKQFPVPIPPEDEQEQLVADLLERLEQLRRLRAGVERATARSTNLRRELLAAAFRGYLVDQDPTDEPADVLLARIRSEREAGAPKKEPRTRKVTAR